MVPEGWELVKLGDVLERVKRSVEVDPNQEYREIGIRSHGKGIFHKKPVTGKVLGNKSVYWVEPDCFVCNIVFAWEQAVAVTTDEEEGFIASHRFPMYRPKSGRISIEYLLYFFRTKRGKHLLGLASPGGAGRNKTLGQAEFANIDISLPPLDEQRKIVSILGVWDRAISLVDSQIEIKKSKKKVIEDDLLVGNKRFPSFTRKWKKVKLSDVGTTYPGLSGKSKDDFGAGKPFITYVNIFRNSAIDLNSLDFVKVSEREKQTKVLRGDIFFTTSSETPEEVGMSSVLLEDVGDLYLNSFCFGFRVNTPKELLPEYARYLFRGKEVRKQISKLAQGSTRYNLPKKQFLMIETIIPSIEEQSKISSLLSLFDSEIDLLKAKSKSFRSGKSALISKLLTGQNRAYRGG